MIKIRHLAGVAGAGAATYVLLVRGALTVDLGIGRRVRRLGPISLDIAAPPEVVFDVISAPYLGKTPRAMEDKLRVLERGSDMVLAEHFTNVGRWLKATTLEVVCFERPSHVSFRLLRGPVASVTETFGLERRGDSTAFSYTGEMGSDLWALGERWAAGVAKRWEKVVEGSIAGVKAEAERRVERTRSNDLA